MHLAAEVKYASRIYVNDANSDAASASTVANLGAGWQQEFGGVRLREFVRIDNVTNRRYAGSVIVAKSQGRYFESAPGRNYLAGIDVSIPF
jgi:iron complex outermembrane receptor protein